MNPETFREIFLPGNPESPSQARDEVRKWLGENHPAYENARLAVSELVTNAVQHARHGAAGFEAGDPLLLRLVTCGGLLRIEVVDAGLGAGEPRARADPELPLAESGRGLAIVGVLSDGNWGHSSNGQEPGRTVWCELPADPQSSDEHLTGTSAPPVSR
ncbi:ATP-binding protein [Streptosporangium subroseum]|uniref:ATP-binding protein n=1 Tax=Streptosporangium subroseum TaxID=106412 RepID=UPI003429905B